jgi:sensor c-di-GMP phosphodiesterase-like protein
MSTAPPVSLLSQLINESIFNVLIEIKNNSGLTCTTIQNVSLNILPGSNIDCPLDVVQQNVSNCDINTLYNLQSNINYNKLIEQAVDRLQQNAQFQQLASAASQSSNAQIDLRTHVKNVLETNYNSDTVNSCMLIASSIQKMGIVLQGNVTQCPDPIRLAQNAQLFGLANCLANHITNILANDQILNNALSQAQVTPMPTVAAPPTTPTAIFNMNQPNTADTKGSSTKNTLIVGSIIFGVLLIIAFILVLASPRKK